MYYYSRLDTVFLFRTVALHSTSRRQIHSRYKNLIRCNLLTKQNLDKNNGHKYSKTDCNICLLYDNLIYYKQVKSGTKWRNSTKQAINANKLVVTYIYFITTIFL